MGALPDGWDKQFEKTAYDSGMNREYTRIAYESEDGIIVRISDVQEPNSFDGWGYLVRTDELGSGPLGLVADIDDAKELAETYMREQSPATA